ncbi:Ribonuclease/ribotoxin [Trichoderma chlorosporum]
MVSFKIVAAVVGLASSVSAVAIEKRASSCVYTCGSTCYWQSDIDSALSAGVKLFQEGKTLGSDDYPHQYNDYEGFNFPTGSPWYEFPILNTFKVYSGGSPGADRVIFDSDGNFDSVITHTGASGDDFVACQQD